MPRWRTNWPRSSPAMGAVQKMQLPGTRDPATYVIRQGAHRRFTPSSAAASRVDELAQPLADLEERNPFLGHVDVRPRLGIATLAGVPVPDPETAKAPQLDLVTLGEGLGDVVEDGIDDRLGLFLREVRDFRDFVDQLGFGHRRLRLVSRPALEFRPNGSMPAPRMSTSARS